MSNLNNEVPPLDSGDVSVFDDLSKRNQSRQNNSHSYGTSRRKDTNSPTRHQINNKKQGNGSRSPRRHANSPKRNQPADMSVIVKRIDLWDTIKFGHYEEGDNLPCLDHGQVDRHPPIHPYHFAPDVTCWTGTSGPEAKNCTVAVIRAPHHPGKQEKIAAWNENALDPRDVVDHSIPNPYDPSVCHDKYWAQRRRLFSKFDMGIQLDAEGWFSVTPEVIADHVAQRVGSLATSAAFRRGLPGNLPESQGIIVMDAFCGCGGNSIAFGKLPYDQVAMVVCIDLDRTKLRKAAQNACLYDIPKEKLIFVECNTLFVMEHCYRNGILQINELRSSGASLPDHVQTEVCAGFFIGGLGMLPPRIDAVFMDPPWGGVDYNALGKNGYTLESHMKIKRIGMKAKMPAIQDDFFDSFGTAGPVAPADDENCMNGVHLLQMAASATRSRLVIYDLPRNTNKSALGQSALVAGYRGNMKLEEHYLNGRLKTVTAYMGADYSNVLMGSEEQSS